MVQTISISSQTTTMKNTFSLLTITILLSMPFLFIKSTTINNDNRETFSSYKEPEREAYDALTFVSAANAFPNSDIPSDGYAKAWVKHRQILAAAKPAGTRSGWETIGPNNIGGRTVSIAIDPVDTGIIWLGSASGGLWKSTKGGNGINAWTYISTGYPVLGVGAVSINPTNHDEMFIGTGETYSYGTSTSGLIDRTQRGSFGIGILKSTDGGSSWSMSLDWTYQQNRGVWDVLYNPLNTSILYAATTEGVYKSSDGGSTWINVLDKKMVMDLEIDHVDTNIIYAGVGNEDSADKGIYKTTNGGATWTLLTGNGLPAAYTNDGRITISTYDGDNHTVMALIANRYYTQGIYKSINQGQTWTLQTSYDIVSYQGWYAKGLLMKSNDASKVFAGGVNLFKSNNSGSSFSNINGYVHSDIHGIISNPLDANKIYVITDGGLFRSNNFGQTFSDCNDGYVTSQQYIGSLSATNPDVGLAGLQDNSTIKYDGTNYWTSVIGGDGCYNAIDPNSDFVQYGLYQYLNVYKSTDQGYNWNNVYYSNSDPLGGNPAAFLAPFVMSFSNPSVLYGGSTTLIKSTNGGSSFFNQQPDPVDNGNYVLSIGVSKTNPDTMYFATAPSDTYPMHMFRSANGGATKTDISNGLPNRYPMRITVSPENSSVVYAVFGGFGTGHLYKSINGGAAWTDISTDLPDLPFHCLAVDPLQPNNIYAGCDFTVYASTDGGQTWSTFADDLPEAVMIWDLVVSASDHMLYAFTHGHGTYKRDFLPTGINDQAILVSTTRITVYPNPATNNITVTWNTDLKDPFVISLVDLKGNTVIYNTMPVTTLRTLNLDITAVPNGSYLLKVEAPGIRKVQKVVVMN